MDLRLENVKEIPSPSTPPEEQRECRLAKYNDQNDQNDQIVLLDPKDWGQNPDDPRGNKVYERFKELAQKLSTVRHEDCQTLHCKGWFQDQVKRQFYLVYEPPSSCQAPTKYATLHELFESTFKPSLTDRFILARKIARTVRRLHEEELLHKGIRSKNVIFFPTRTGASRSIDDPWLVGFDFARRDSDGQYSEKDIKMLVFQVIHLSMLCCLLTVPRIGVRTPASTATLMPFAIIASRLPGYMTIIASGSC